MIISMGQNIDWATKWKLLPIDKVGSVHEAHDTYLIAKVFLSSEYCKFSLLSTSKKILGHLPEFYASNHPIKAGIASYFF